MHENPPSTCPHCDAAMIAGPSGAVCPRCAADMLQGSQTAANGQPGASAPFTPPSVAEVAGKFPQLEILSLIGKGGMGAVYKARQPQLDRIVALKILPPGIGDDPAFAERFIREARALAMLSHPNIVTIHDFGNTGGPGGLYYLLMEYVDGITLRRLLETRRVSPREALAIVPEICDALQFAHDHGIVHRDIKPENVLLDRRGRVKVADFGLAKLIGADADIIRAAVASVEGVSLTETGKVMGTPQYMAPEQRENPGEVDHRADIYALGVVFYQMLTGELPGKRIEAPSKKVRIDVRLDEIVLRALEQEPNLRYQQASIFKTQVETIAATSPSAASAEENDSPRNSGTGKTEKGHHRSFTGLAWSLVPLAAVLLAFFNPWGSRAWYYFAAACAILALLPPFRFKRRGQTSFDSQSAKSSGSPSLAKLSLGLLLLGLLGTPMLLALAPTYSQDAVAVFAAMSLLLAMIFGFFSRSRLGIGVAIGCVTVFIVFGAWTWYMRQTFIRSSVEMQDKMVLKVQQDREKFKELNRMAMLQQTAHPAVPPVDAAQLSVPPQLRCIAWLYEVNTDPAWQAWTPAGLPTNRRELALPVGTSNGITKTWIATGAAVNTYGNERKTPFLCLWFSHLLFDQDSASEVTLLDDAGKPLFSDDHASAGNTSRAISREPGKSMGWITAVEFAGRSGKTPATVTVRLRYTIGPWEQWGDIKDFSKPAQLEKGVTATVRQDFSVDLIRDPAQDEGGTEYDFTALEDGNQWSHDNIGDGIDQYGAKTRHYSFGGLFHPGTTIRVTMRKFKTIEFKNVTVPQEATQPAQPQPAPAPVTAPR